MSCRLNLKLKEKKIKTAFQDVRRRITVLRAEAPVNEAAN
jgi:hypothetical protein